MKVLKTLSVLVAIAGVGVLAVAAAPSIYGQRPGDAQRLLRELMVLPGRGAQIGVSIRDVEPAEAERQKTQGGVLVEEVLPDTPAEKAGLKASDIVVEFDLEHVRSARQFSRLVQETAPGRTVKAGIVRDGQKKDVQITPSSDSRADRIGVFPDGGRLRERLGELADRLPPLDFTFDGPGRAPAGRLGVSVSELTMQLANYFGAKEGVLVTGVTDQSPAARAGLKAGDVITSINNKRVVSRGDLVRALQDIGEGDITIGIVREKKESTVKAKIEAPSRNDRNYRSVRPA